MGSEPQSGAQAKGEAMIVVHSRFHGPPDVANGGYLAGRMATYVAGDAEVTLRRPAPLEQPLRLMEADGRTHLLSGDAVVAEARAAQWDLQFPDPVTLADASDAQGLDIWRAQPHPFPSCFVCGPDSADGLRIFPGGVTGRPGIVAAVWTPAQDLVAEDGAAVAREFLWAALDCPGYHGARAGDPTMPVQALLGRMAARVLSPVQPGEPLVATGWFVGREGRKIQAGTALHEASGRLVAAARTTWIVLE